MSNPTDIETIEYDKLRSLTDGLKVKLLAFLDTQISVSEKKGFNEFKDSIQAKIRERMELGPEEPGSFSSSQLVKLFETVLKHENENAIGILNIIKEHINSSVLADKLKDGLTRGLVGEIDQDTVKQYKNIEEVLNVLLTLGKNLKKNE